MYLEIDSRNSERVFAQFFGQILNSNKRVSETKDDPRPLTDEEIKALVHKELPDIKVEDVKNELDKLAAISEIVNKRVKLSVNRDINRVVITIVEKDTNKVIKEIPCEELQNLARHLKEAIGILFDKTA